jgi:hypothetical protein
MQESGERVGTVVDVISAGNDLLEVQLDRDYGDKGDKEDKGDKGDKEDKGDKRTRENYEFILHPFLASCLMKRF